MDIPESVEIVSEYFRKNSVWHNITPNLRAQSCKDAARKRNRLGQTGIPLFDELKSNFGYCVDKNGEINYVLLHCRGNQLIDEEKVRSVLSSQFHRLDADKIFTIFGLEYGTVNPIISIQDKTILQIFDETILKKYLPPYTMMTNAGHFEWGIEFHPNELVNKLKNVRVADIIKDETKPKFKDHKIGILTGNPPESGMYLWRLINDHIKSELKSKFLGDISYPNIIIESIPDMGISMELGLREEATWKVVENGVVRLCQAGATIIGIVCNITQYYQDRIKTICKSYNATFIPMADALLECLEKSEETEFDFLGINYVSDFDQWSAYKVLKKKYKINIPPDEVLNSIKDLAFLVKKENISGRGINKLRDIINNHTTSDNIIIASTEMSLLLFEQHGKSRKGKQFIDTLQILANKMADVYLADVNS